MQKSSKASGIAIILAGLLAVPANVIPARAAPPGIVHSAQTNASSPATLQNVRWHGRHHRHWRGHHRHWRGHHRHHHGWNPGAAVAVGIIGSLIAEGLSEGDARGAVQRCENRYRSFDPATGYYTTYGGDKRLCPYLR